MSDDSLLARARVMRDGKVQRGVYPQTLLEALDEPLDVRPDPAVAAGPAWPEAQGTAAITVEPPPRSRRLLLGPLLTLCKRAVYRSLRWYLPPVAEQATRHNRAVLEVLEAHNRQIVELRREVDRLRQRVAQLDKRA